MAKQVTLQEVLSAIGGPLSEVSLWALLYRAHEGLKRAIEGKERYRLGLDSYYPPPPTDVSIGRELDLLITPESMLLGFGGTVQLLPGISHDSSNFSAPELRNTQNPIDIEKVRSLI